MKTPFSPMSTRIAAAGLLTLLAACAGAPAEPMPDDATDLLAPISPSPPTQEHGVTRELTPREHRVIDELTAVAERVRGLRLKHAVPVRVQDPEAIASFIDRQIETEELDRSGKIYTALGLLEPGLDVRSLLLRLMAEQIVGYYDPEEKHLVVRDDVMRAMDQDPSDGNLELVEARIVLVHEIVHALQDQHLGLGEAIDLERDTDGDNAFRSLIEGDAYLAMLGATHASGALPLDTLTARPEFRAMITEAFRQAPLAGEELMSAPAIVRVPLLSAYVDGLSFAAALHAEGGWPSVDRAHRSPPASTEHVLHPERYLRGETSETVDLDGLAAILVAAGYRSLDEDTLGELELGIYFAQSADEDEALRGAEGWSGDRLYAFSAASGNGVAVVWASRWDTAAEAQEAEHAARIVHAWITEPAVSRTSLVSRSGRSLVVARGLPEGLHAQVQSLFERSATRAR